jgi:hypothetical protein
MDMAYATQDKQTYPIPATTATARTSHAVSKPCIFLAHPNHMLIIEVGQDASDTA